MVAVNPYAAALDGLALADPVAAFFAFCRERERIRTLRESGAPPPWSDDPIFQQGRFLNVFREDDRGSLSLIRFVQPQASDLSALVHALFFARWCNRPSTLDALSAAQLEEPESLRRTLGTLPEQPWCNVTAYPVEFIRWQGKVISRLDAATTLFLRIKGRLTEAIAAANGDVVIAVSNINAMFQMENDFPIFMAVMDLAWFRPDVIDPGSHVPVGIGAVAFLDRLQTHLGALNHRQTCEEMIALQTEHWPEARRLLQPIDIEYLCCECRKYYSYVNGTKRFEGKNIFRAEERARLHFDIADPDPDGGVVQTRVQVIAGGPCSGKSTLIQALEEAGCGVVPETAECALKAGVAGGLSAEALRADPVQWQQEMLTRDHALFEGLAPDRLVFTDTSFIEDVVFSARAGLAVGPGIQSWLGRKRYQRVFFLAPLEEYERNSVRMESQGAAAQISAQVQACYREYGYEPVVVAAMGVAERVAFILSHVSERATQG